MFEIELVISPMKTFVGREHILCLNEPFQPRDVASLIILPLDINADIISFKIKHQFKCGF